MFRKQTKLFQIDFHGLNSTSSGRYKKNPFQMNNKFQSQAAELMSNEITAKWVLSLVRYTSAFGRTTSFKTSLTKCLLKYAKREYNLVLFAATLLLSISFLIEKFFKYQNTRDLYSKRAEISHSTE